MLTLVSLFAIHFPDTSLFYDRENLIAVALCLYWLSLCLYVKLVQTPLITSDLEAIN